MTAIAGLPGPAVTRGDRGAGPLGNEAMLLRYPLRPGLRWDIRPRPQLSAEVEGLDVIHLGKLRMSAYRIRYTGESLGANDQFRVWYGRTGYLGLSGHASYVDTDPNGNPRGTVVAIFAEVLDNMSLVELAGRRGK